MTFVRQDQDIRSGWSWKKLWGVMANILLCIKVKDKDNVVFVLFLLNAADVIYQLPWLASVVKLIHSITTFHPQAIKIHKYNQVSALLSFVYVLVEDKGWVHYGNLSTIFFPLPCVQLLRHRQHKQSRVLLGCPSSHGWYSNKRVTFIRNSSCGFSQVCLND